MQHAVWLTAGEGIDAAEMVELGTLAEQAGWDGVFVSDSLPSADYPDPWVVLAGVAARTEDVTLGTWVTPLPRRQPWQVASEVATLDRLSGGRVMLGAGIGNEEDYAAYGQSFTARERGDRLDETLDVVTGLWTGEPFTYDGEHFQLENAEVHPTPLQQPRVPILVGCWWPNEKPIRRGARWDGIVPFFPSLVESGAGPHGERETGTPEEEVREALACYREHADAGGEVVLPSFPAEDPAAFAAEAAEMGVTWMLETAPGTSRAAVERTIREGPPAAPAAE
jgi:alkanesulfonate monooxygenase SsuD/methylene tetrahydromethanopterin reductase-like flavin-dependent oxidoreductase (luciferase family)